MRDTEVRCRIEAIDEDDLLDEWVAQTPAFQERIRKAVEQVRCGEGRLLEEMKRDLLLD